MTVHARSRRARLVTAVAASLLVLVSTVEAIAVAPLAHAETGGGLAWHYSSGDVRAASFNLSSLAFERTAKGSHRRWHVRRGVIVKQILDNSPDVIGLQEAAQSNIYRRYVHFGVNQYTDVLGALRHHHGTYALTNGYAYNCRHAASTWHCKKQDRHASGDDRILYNVKTLTMVKEGALRYKAQSRGRNDRFLDWAVFEVRATGKRFFFANTHLDPYSVKVRKAEWDELVAATNRLKGGLPVIDVGDFNTSKWSDYAGTYLPKMAAAGYGDAVGQQWRTPVANNRAHTTYNGSLNSFNGWHRRPPRAHDKTWAGNSIDWVFVTNAAVVKSWKVVASINPRTKRVRGTLPSDHFMVMATITLP